MCAGVTMSARSILSGPEHDGVEFVDYQTVRWGNVSRSLYWLHKRFHYTYPGPIRQLRQRLIVVPPDQYGDQRLHSYGVQVRGAAEAERHELTEAGNRVLSFSIPEVTAEVTFDVTMTIERTGQPALLPRLSARQAARFLSPTPLTMPDAGIQAAARALQAEHRDPERLADAINSWVFAAMRYAWGATNVHTTAAQVLAIGQGLCQDYTHLMLAICRAAGLPARYVSGHLLGEGGSHAWVEVLLPDGSDFVAVPFDPTNHRRANLGYVTIAAGRDYHDVSPTSGRFIAPYAGQLISSKRAGLLSVEYAA
jgi:transglutaminase-like putative cysteine protease